MRLSWSKSVLFPFAPLKKRTYKDTLWSKKVTKEPRTDIKRLARRLMSAKGKGKRPGA
jgi:hypothetical protein